MTEPMTPEDLDPCEHFPEDSKWTCLNADAFHDTCKPCRVRDTIDKLVARVEGVERGLDELRWLMDNSHVTGLRSDGGEMSWSEVRKLYLPDLSRVLEGTE